MAVAVEAIQFEVEVSNVDILPAIAIDVGGVDAHAGFVATVFTGGNSGHQRYIFEGAVMFIEEEEIGPGVVCNRDVGPSVVVEVGEYDAHALGFRLAYAGRTARVGESPVVVVVVELDVLALVISGMAVGTVSRTLLTAPQVVFGGPLDVVRDNKIEPSVFVVIEPPGAGGPSSFVGNASFRSDVGESSVAIIVIENRAAITGDVQIRVSVVVEVADGNTLTIVTFAAYAGLFRDIGESAVAVVVVKSAAQRVRRLVGVSCRRLDEEEIHEPILIVVDPGNACAHRLQVILLVGLRGILLKSDFGLLTDVGEAHGDGGVGSGLGCKHSQADVRSDDSSESQE